MAKTKLLQDRIGSGAYDRIFSEMYTKETDIQTIRQCYINAIRGYEDAFGEEEVSLFVKEYQRQMEAALGKSCCEVLKIRNFGGLKIEP
ncbi:MAG: hypothetical protein J6P60_04040 [Lachnospiraceae bacterium]|nr:hypothetical protein [Lachnospiraceae bacterium]